MYVCVWVYVCARERARRHGERARVDLALKTLHKEQVRNNRVCVLEGETERGCGLHSEPTVITSLCVCVYVSCMRVCGPAASASSIFLRGNVANLATSVILAEQRSLS